MTAGSSHSTAGCRRYLRHPALRRSLPHPVAEQRPHAALVIGRRKWRADVVCPERGGLRLVVVKNPRLGYLVATGVEHMGVGLFERLVGASAGRPGQDNDAFGSFRDPVTDTRKVPSRACRSRGLERGLGDARTRLGRIVGRRRTANPRWHTSALDARRSRLARHRVVASFVSHVALPQLGTTTRGRATEG
jgi:hypothetical protein